MYDTKTHIDIVATKTILKNKLKHSNNYSNLHRMYQNVCIHLHWVGDIKFKVLCEKF